MRGRSRRVGDTWNGLLPPALALARVLEVEMDRALAMVPLSARGLVTLLEIARAPAATQRHLAHRLALTPSATSELLARLARHGLIVRAARRRGGVRGAKDAPDPGATVVSLTARGHHRLARAEAVASRLEDDWADRLGAGDPKGTRALRANGLARRLRESLAALAAGDANPAAAGRADIDAGGRGGREYPAMNVTSRPSHRVAALARGAAALTAIFVLATAGAEAQQPGASPSAGAQGATDQSGLGSLIRQRIQQSGLTPEEIRARLRAAGYPDSALDAYLGPAAGGGQVPAPTAQTLRAATAAQLGEFGTQVDTTNALRREVVLTQGDSILLDSLGFVLGRDSIPGTMGPGGVMRLDTAAALRIAAWLKRPRVFGLDVFRRTTTQFNPVASGPVDAGYRLGPGDDLLLILTGDVDVVEDLPVTREGFVVIPQVGRVPVANLTLGELRTLLASRLARVYSGVRTGTIHYDVTVSRVRMNQVFVDGEVARPGSYPVSALGTVMTALYQAGGPTEAANFRDVRVLRGERVVSHLDLYDYLVRGMTHDDVRLEQGDVVFVPPRVRRVLISGSVLRPGYYDLADSEDLGALIKFAGGLLPEADQARAHVERILPESQRGPDGRDRVAMDVDDLAHVLDGTAPHRFRLEPDDRVTIFPVRTPVRDQVTLRGSVWQPGPYAITTGMTLSQLLAKAGGLKPDAYLDRAHIVRLMPDSTRTLVPVDLRPLIGPDGRVLPDAPAGSDPVLKEFDDITVFASTDFRPRREIRVFGAVQRPGSFPFRDSMTVRDAIILAGGLKDDAYLLEAEISRLPESPTDTSALAQIIQVPLDSSYVIDPTAYVRRVTSGHGTNPVLQPFDYVFVRRVPGLEPQRTVVVTGQVRFPGHYTLTSRHERLRDILLRAGGMTPNAYVNGAQFFREVGHAGRIGINFEAVLRDARHRDNLPLFAGDSIYVPEYQPIVSVEGAVNSPVAVAYERGRGTSYYVDRAGGYARHADKGRTYVIQPNGSIYKSSATPEPGARVVVPLTPPGEITDWPRLISGLAQLLVSAVTLAVLAKQL
jgi:polysaccharide biosynthesis/export protein